MSCFCLIFFRTESESMRDGCVVEMPVSAKDPSQHWLTLKDLAHGGRLMTEIRR